MLELGGSWEEKTGPGLLPGGHPKSRLGQGSTEKPKMGGGVRGSWEPGGSHDLCLRSVPEILEGGIESLKPYLQKYWLRLFQNCT